jgi:ferredoxin-NADP reductase
MTAPLLRARVQAVRYEAPRVLSLELRVLDAQLPPVGPGAHVDLHLAGGLIRSYSLTDADPAGKFLRIGVLHDRGSRGGSRLIHEKLRVGDVLEMSTPRNHFMLDAEAPLSVLVAGGIGVTPLLWMLRRLTSEGRPVRLIYAVREREDAAFLEEIGTLVAANGVPFHLHVDAEAVGQPDLAQLLTGLPADTHIYGCGPTPMLDALQNACAALDLPHLRMERFAAPARETPLMPNASYMVELRRSNRELPVPSDKTLLDTLLDAGVHVDYSCMAGVCGACETQVILGDVDHQDFVLTPEEHAHAGTMMVCVSGCKSERLVLDL